LPDREQQALDPQDRGKLRRMNIAGLVKLAIALLFFLGDRAAGGLRSLIGREPPPRLVVLTYHSIPAGGRTSFLRQMDMVLRAGRPVRPDLALPPRGSGLLIGVTFDDAFENVVVNALPALEERGMPAVIFAPACLLGGRPAWIKEGRRNSAEPTIPPHGLKRLAEEGWIIGSHGLSHVRLSTLDRDGKSREIGGSKTVLESIIGRPVSLFSFPFGDTDEECLAMARSAGYERVFLNIPTMGSSRPGGFVVGRINMDLDDRDLECFLKIRGCYRWQSWIFDAKSLLKRVRTPHRAERDGP
jgi:hypothetical protein